VTAINSTQQSDQSGSGKDRAGVQVIARAAALLHALKQHPDGLTLGELAKLLSLPRSTVQRIVDALHAEHLVIAASLSRGVRLGPAILALAAATRFEIAEVARPTLQQIARECGETVNLSLLDDGRAVFVEQVAGIHRLRADSGVGFSLPLHSNAAGKTMLAAMSEASLRDIRPTLQLTQLTPNTIITWDALEEALKTIRETGIATDFEENVLGICGLGTALHLPNGGLAAISIPVPAQRFADSRVHLQTLLETHCNRLRQRLGQ